MTTDTEHDDPVLLDEAEAIVAAEWMRLTQDDDIWDRELADQFADVPTPRPRTAQVDSSTAVRRRPRAAPPSHPKGRPARRCPRLRVRATQRSPPTSTPEFCCRRRWRATEVMP